MYHSLGPVVGQCCFTRPGRTLLGHVCSKVALPSLAFAWSHQTWANLAQPCTSIAWLAQPWAKVPQPSLAFHGWARIGPTFLNQSWHYMLGPVLDQCSLAKPGICLVEPGLGQSCSAMHWPCMVGPAMGQCCNAKPGKAWLAQAWAKVTMPSLAQHGWPSPGPILLSHALAFHGWPSHGPRLQCQPWHNMLGPGLGLDSGAMQWHCMLGPAMGLGCSA